MSSTILRVLPSLTEAFTMVQYMLLGAKEADAKEGDAETAVTLWSVAR